MDIYSLGKIARTTDGRGEFFHAFNIIGVQGRPVVGFAFETQEEAEAAHKAHAGDCRHSQTDYALSPTVPALISK
jgi:hypothetical protein